MFPIQQSQHYVSEWRITLIHKTDNHPKILYSFHLPALADSLALGFSFESDARSFNSSVLPLDGDCDDKEHKQNTDE